MNKTKKIPNRGRTVIEITLLIPVFFGCIYLYIMLFLFLMESTKQMDHICEELYHTEAAKLDSQGGEIIFHIKGKTYTAAVYDTGKLFTIDLQLSRDGSDAIENIRRWQLAAGGI